LFYLVFESITYQFFTKPYYPDATQIVARLGLWFWLIQIARGVLMTLAVIPVIRTLRMSRLHAAIAVGLLLWGCGRAGATSFAQSLDDRDPALLSRHRNIDAERALRHNRRAPAP
jgi:hypothetical protein